MNGKSQGERFCSSDKHAQLSTDERTIIQEDTYLEEGIDAMASRDMVIKGEEERKRVASVVGENIGNAEPRHRGFYIEGTTLDD